MPRIFPGGVFTAVADGRTFGVISNDDIADDIQSCRAGFALLGADNYEELANKALFQFDPVAKLDCQLVLAVPSEAVLHTPEMLVTATSYPRAFQRFIGRTGINAILGPVRSGKVEATCKLGMAQAIFDIRQTGESMTANGYNVIAEDDYLELGGFWLNEPYNGA